MRIPFIILVLTTQALAVTPSGDLLKCQKTLDSKARGVASTEQRVLVDCTLRAVNCKLAQEIDTVDPTACLASATSRCADPDTGAAAKVNKTLTSGKGKALTACGLIPLADVNAFLAGLGFFNVTAACGAASVSDLIDCVFADAMCSNERAIFIADPRAQDSLTALGIAAQFPCVGPTSSTTTTTTTSTTTTT